MSDRILFADSVDGRAAAETFAQTHGGTVERVAHCAACEAFVFEVLPLPAGWTFEHTGGNCTAWTHPAAVPGFAWYLTCELDALAPDNAAEPVALNLMSGEHGDPIIGLTCPTLAEALELVARFDGAADENERCDEPGCSAKCTAPSIGPNGGTWFYCAHHARGKEPAK